MTRTYFLFVLLFLTTPMFLFGQQDIIDFYPFADSLSAYPPFKNELTILCNKKIDNRHITIIGFKEDKNVLLAAVTLQPIKDLKKDISLSVQFNGMTPNVGKTLTWGYIFDRNGDGSIDYMALLGGAAPFKDDKFPEDYPYRGQPLLYHHMQYFISHCKLAFNHWADDNFDGALDALIHVDVEPDRDYIGRHIVVRSTAFDGTFSDIWAFKSSDKTIQDSISFTPDGVPYRPIGKEEGMISPATLEEKTGIMKLINTALKQCKLTEKNFTRFKQ